MSREYERLAKGLDELADNEQRTAEQLKGCSFMGDPPHLTHEKIAGDLRLAAKILRGMRQ